MVDDHSEPMSVKSLHGSVVVLGPRMEGSFTPDAAEESARLLLIAAAEAREWIDPVLVRLRP